MTKQTKLQHQLPDGGIATRTTARTYTHVVIARTDVNRRRTDALKLQDVDRRNFEFYARCVATGRHGAHAVSAADIATYKAILAATPDAESYAASCAQRRLEKVNQEYGAADYSDWFVCAWCGREDLADKEARRVVKYAYSDIRVEPINHGVREGV